MFDVQIAGFTVLNPFLWLDDHVIVDNLPEFKYGSYTHADRLSEFAARTCYDSTNKLGANKNFLKNVIGRTHLDVIEHPAIVLRVESSRKIYWYEIDKFMDVTTRYDHDVERYIYYVSMNLNVFFRVLAMGKFHDVVDEGIIYVPESFEDTNLFKLWVAANILFPMTTEGFKTQSLWVEMKADALIEKYEDPNYTGPASDIIEQIAEISEGYVYASKVLTVNFDAGSDLCYTYLGNTIIALLAFTVMNESFLAELKQFDGYRNIFRYSFLVDGLSRSCTHQLVRHRLLSISQLSQRYVEFDGGDVTDDGFVVPTSIEDNKTAYEIYKDAMISIQRAYVALRECEIFKEDARFVLPNAARTQIVFSGNGNAMDHFFKLRTASDAQWEIRDIAREMASFYNILAREFVE